MRLSLPASSQLKWVSSKGWVLAALAAGPASLFFPALFLGRVLFWGAPMLQFVPWRQFALQTVLGGHLPLWNPLVGLGAPLLANYQSALLYPPTWLQAVMGVASGQAWLVALHLFWSGVGVWVLARRLGLGSLASLVAGMSFSLSTYVVGRSGFLPINASVAWLPWIIVGVDRLAAAPSDGWLNLRDRGAFPLTVAALAFQWLSGHAQIAWYTFLLATAWLTWRVLENRHAGMPLRAFARFGLASAVAGCLAAPQLLPTLEYLSISQRGVSVGRDLAMTYSFWPWHLLGLLTPDLFGSPVAGDYWGYGNYWEDAIYVGILPLCMAIAAGWRAIRGRGPLPGLGRFLIGLGAVSLLLALGWNTPVYPLLFDWVPSFALFQAPSRWMLWLVFALALLAGLGVQAWGTARNRNLYWLRLGTAGGVAVVLGALVAAQALPGVRSTFVRSVGTAGLWLVVTGALALMRRPEPGKLWKGAVGVAVIADLVIAGWGLNPMARAELYQGASRLVPQLGGNGRVYMAPDVEYRYKYGTVFKFDTFQPAFNFTEVRQYGLANANMLDGIQSVNNFDPILPGRYAVMVSAIPDLPEQIQARWLTAFDVRLAATALDAAGRPVLKPLSGGQRAWFVDRVQFAADESDGLHQSLAADFDPTRVAVVEGLTETFAPLLPGQGDAEWRPSDDPNRFLVETHSDSGGWVTLSTAYAPGWAAKLDGNPMPVYPADGVLMAVWVPAGDHVLDFSYGSTALVAGLALAILGLAAMAGLSRLR